jgi:hypothetical protein
MIKKGMEDYKLLFLLNYLLVLIPKVIQESTVFLDLFLTDVQ